ncbi:uncharacterized protein N7482_006407 [Penicillium canariense]|uniref:Uncharacterized protein n=1 Tax=Penicillium canariense TaxID=189055 RepID=A0A9W9HX36_9EURO|nr:uncharacterized protein N7482_006407 [Penicillium canariense]KAJ5159403.1 hypothetical protein N7482_006407 [Penicillium canariense]
MATKYTAAHESPNGPGDSLILITGCSSGLGIETVRALARTGATLFVTARDPYKAKAALGNLLESDKIHLLALDLNSFASVRACASEFLSKSYRKLNILIANAGVMATPEGKPSTASRPNSASSTPTSPSRVVFVSSAAYRISTVHMDNLSLAGEYDPWKAYGQSKTAIIWTANEVQRRYGSKGLLAFSLHPGGITTGSQQHVPDEVQQSWGADKSFKLRWKSLEQGAATTVWAAVAKALEEHGGKYLDDCQIAGPHNPETGPMGPGYAPWAYDEVNAAKLWDVSMKMVGLDGED